MDMRVGTHFLKELADVVVRLHLLSVTTAVTGEVPDGWKEANASSIF